MRSRAMRATEGTLAAIYWARYDRYHRRDAERALAGLARTGRHLSADARRQCDEYAHDRLGSGHYAPWLHAYAACAGGFREGWIPDNYYGRWVVPVMANDLEGLAATRSLTRRALDTDAVPDVAYVIDGRLHDLDMQPTSPEAVADVLGGDDAVFKADSSSQGRGVNRLSAADVAGVEVAALPDGVIQRWVHQHPAFAEVMDASVGTLRLTTLREPDGSISLRTRLVRFGGAGVAVVGRGVTYAVTVEDDGTMGAWGLTGEWGLTSAHPDSGVAVGGRVVPQFRAAVDLVTELHARVPQVGLVGWDVTVDVEGRVWLLEWNVGHAGIARAEMLSGPCFADLGWDRLHARREA